MNTGDIMVAAADTLSPGLGSEGKEADSATPPAKHGPATEPNTEPVECARCGHVGEPTGKGQCGACGCWLPGNAANLRHGLRRYQETGVLPDDLAEYRAARSAELVEALGGADDLSPQREMLAGHAVNLEATGLLQLDFALRQGADTKRGRQSLADYRATVLALRAVLNDLGLDRRAKVETLDDVMERIAREQGKDGGAA